jgi:hypothetical protein
MVKNLATEFDTCPNCNRILGVHTTEQLFLCKRIIELQSMYGKPIPVQFLFDSDVRNHIKTCQQCKSIKEGIIQESKKQNVGKVNLEGFTKFLLQPKNLDGMKLVINHTRQEIKN